MSNINIKNGIQIANFNNYSIYQMYTEDTEEYYMSIPNTLSNEYQMIIDFPEEYYKSLLKNEIIDEIKNICDNLYNDDNNYIYILSNISTYEYNEAKNDNDDRSYRILLRRLQKYTYNAYKSITESTKEPIKINQIISIIKQTDDDKKFTNWLDINLNGFFKWVDLSNLYDKEKDNIAINDDTGWTSLGGLSNGGNENIELNNNLTKPKVKLLIPNKHGFVNIAWFSLILVVSIAIAFVLANILIKL